MSDLTADTSPLTAWQAFLSEQGAQWHNGELRRFDSDKPPSQPWLIPLEHQRLLVISGVDAEKFLQGQLTCDVRRLAEHKLLMGAHCDHKGRMHSSFTSASYGTGIGLRLHASIAASAQAALAKYSVFSKVDLAVEDDVRMFALIGAGAEEAAEFLPVDPPLDHGCFATGDGVTLLRHSHTHIEIWIRADQAQALWQALAPSCTPAAPEQWDLAHIELGIGQVREETRGEFIPQMLNFQTTNGISFDKGCYTGQEVVARMHYLGKLKKHMYRATVESSDVPIPGAALYEAGSEIVVGQVVMAAASDAGAVALLAVCTEQTVAESAVALSPTANAKLQWQPLPYELN